MQRSLSAMEMRTAITISESFKSGRKAILTHAREGTFVGRVACQLDSKAEVFSTEATAVPALLIKTASGYYLMYLLGSLKSGRSYYLVSHTSLTYIALPTSHSPTSLLPTSPLLQYFHLQ